MKSNDLYDNLRTQIEVSLDKKISVPKSFTPSEALNGKKILFLCDLFPPQFAPRAMSVVKHFVNWGAECVVVTEEITEERDSSHGKVFDSMSDCCPTYRFPLRKRNNRSEALRQALWQEKDKSFAKTIKKRLNISDFSLIFAFTFSEFPLKAAQILATESKIPWIADCRDIYEQYNGYRFLPRLTKPIPLLGPFYRLLRHHLVSCRNRCLHDANAVSTVSQWHKKILSRELSPRQRPVFCIYNGYDENLFIPQHHCSDSFFIVFTGRLMNLGMRNPRILFEALENNKIRKILTEGRLRVRWYVDKKSQELLHNLLKDFSGIVGSIQEFLPMVPFEKVPDCLSNASIILLINNKESKDGPHGIVSTKIFEAMAMEKPILSIPGDGAISDRLLKRSEMAKIASNSDEIIEFIEGMYQIWKKNGYTIAKNSDKEFIKQFTRSNNARAFARLAAEYTLK